MGVECICWTCICALACALAINASCILRRTRCQRHQHVVSLIQICMNWHCVRPFWCIVTLHSPTAGSTHSFWCNDCTVALPDCRMSFLACISQFHEPRGVNQSGPHAAVLQLPMSTACCITVLKVAPRRRCAPG